MAWEAALIFDFLRSRYSALSATFLLAIDCLRSSRSLSAFASHSGLGLGLELGLGLLASDRS